MTTQHTPGPWVAMKAQDTDSEGKFSAYIFAEKYGVVGYWRGHKADHTDCNWLLTDEDARLIAAAPDLLEALRLIARWDESESDFELSSPMSPMEIARAAIAKATGTT